MIVILFIYALAGPPAAIPTRAWARCIALAEHAITAGEARCVSTGRDVLVRPL